MSRTITENDYRIFTENEKKYIYIADTGKIYETDTATLDTLKEGAEEQLFYDITEEKKKIACRKAEEKTVSAISLLVIQGCNLRCTYCYGEDGQYQDSGVMDKDTALKSIDFFVKESPADIITICFFGGEPLLNFPVIKEVVNYCRRLQEKSKKTIRFSMTTNGTLINEEIEQFILDNKISVQISLDGDKKTQDKNRFDAAHRGSYDRVIANTKGLREKGVLGVRATLTPFNMNVKEIYRHLDSLGFAKIIISPAFNMMSAADYEVLAEKYIEWYEELEQELKKGNVKYVCKSKLFRQELQKIDRALIRTASCGVGKNTVAIDIHGNVFPCQRFVALKEYCIGNIYEGLQEQKAFLEEVNTADKPQCSECWIRNLCVSGCPFCNVSDTGDIHTQNSMCCEYEKKIYEALIGIYLRLSEEEKRMLFQSR